MWMEVVPLGLKVILGKGKGLGGHRRTSGMRERHQQLPVYRLEQASQPESAGGDAYSACCVLFLVLGACRKV